MELRCGRTRLRLQIVLFVVSFCFVRCLDQFHLYKDDILSKKKIPVEFSEEYHHDLRQRSRREVQPTHSPDIENRTDSFVYYTAQYLRNGKDDYWMELSDNVALKDNYLSSGSLRSKNFQLKFTFPYYGHPITNVSITTGGFLYVGYVETRLKMKVMYIAPLMAFFNTSINKTSAIYRFSNATQFTTQWSNVYLQNGPKVGPFTFQCTLFKDGAIVFAYKSLPVPASMIPIPKEHHVKVGISDAFIGYKWWYIKGRIQKVRIFYIYHSFDYPKGNIKSNSALILTPLMNCVIAKNCTQCIGITGLTDFSCAWCSELKRCSDGLDRHRLQWFAKSCDKVSISKYASCLENNSGGTKKNRQVYSDSSSSGMKVGGIIAICFVLIIIATIGGWFFYAYTHPVSRSGLFLIELRHKPAQLFRRANAATRTGATTGSSTA